MVVFARGEAKRYQNKWIDISILFMLDAGIAQLN